MEYRGFKPATGLWIRRVFIFKSRMVMISVDYLPGTNAWHAAAFRAKGPKGIYDLLGDTRDLCYGCWQRSAAIKGLRRAIAERKNPKLKEVFGKIERRK